MTSPGNPDAEPGTTPPDAAPQQDKRSEALEAELAMLEGLTPDAPAPEERRESKDGQ